MELRVAFIAREYERLVRFYCDGLGLETTQVWPGDQGRAVILDMGQAMLEIFDEKQANTWGDYYVRLQDPEGMQVTLFQVREQS